MRSRDIRDSRRRCVHPQSPTKSIQMDENQLLQPSLPVPNVVFLPSPGPPKPLPLAPSSASQSYFYATSIISYVSKWHI